MTFTGSTLCKEEFHNNGHLTNRARRQKHGLERAFTNAKLVLISRIHGLISFFPYCVYQRVCGGFVGRWRGTCWGEDQGDAPSTPQRVLPSDRLRPPLPPWRARGTPAPVGTRLHQLWTCSRTTPGR